MPDKKKTTDKQDLPLDKVEDAVILENQDDMAAKDSAVPASDEPSEKPEDVVSPDVTAARTDTPAGDVPDEVVGLEDEQSADRSAEEERPAEIAATDQAPTEQEVQGPPADDTPEATANRTEPLQDEGPEQRADPAAVVPREVVTEKVVERKGGFVPMVLGGVVAAGLGFGLAYSGILEGLPLPGSNDLEEHVATLSQQIDAQGGIVSDLEARVETIESAPPPEAPENTDVTPVLDDISSQIEALAQRIAALETRPVGEASGMDADAQAALENTQNEITELRQVLEAQRSELAALSEDAAQEEAAAQLSARQALRRAAMTRIQTALDNGAPYDEALTDLRESDLEIPEPLAEQAESGVATLSELQDSFPDAAREALQAAREETGAAGMTGFLQSQLGLRSLEPREGNDPDAVLSRAEAEVRRGRLPEAIAELESLPDVALAELEAWLMQARTRSTTVVVAQELAQSLNSN